MTLPLFSVLIITPLWKGMCKRVLSIDYGRKRVGLARTDELCIIAVPMEPIDNTPELVGKIIDIVYEMNIEKIIIGIPKRMGGEEGELASEIKEFAGKLQSHLPQIGIIFWDESLTSKDAEKIFVEKFKRLPLKKKDKGIIDSYSAAIILQEYLESGDWTTDE